MNLICYLCKSNIPNIHNINSINITVDTHLGKCTACADLYQIKSVWTTLNIKDDLIKYCHVYALNFIFRIYMYNSTTTAYPYDSYEAIDEIIFNSILTIEQIKEKSKTLALLL